MTTEHEGQQRATRILIVDDDPAILAVLTELLSAEGYTAYQAADGRTALQLVKKHTPDLVILDVMLPDLSGMEVCAQIKQDGALRDTFVVVFSGAATSPEMTIKGLRTGADDYLNKNLHPQEFLARIGTIVRLRHTTAALRKREQHYRGLVQILPDGILTTDLEGTILSANTQAVAMVRCSSEADLIGKTLFDLAHPSERQRMRREMRVTLETGVMRNAEYTFRGLGGGEFPVDLSAAVTRLEGDNPSGVVAVVRDNTERKRTEELLKQRAEFNRRILSTAIDGFWILDKQGHLIDANEAYCAMSGYTLQELLTRNVSDIEFCEDQAAVAAHISKVISVGHDKFETRHRRKNGEVFDVEVSTTFLDLGEGFLFVFLSDITERKRAQAKLSEALNLNESIMAASSVGILAFRRSGACVFTNDAASRMLKSTDHEEVNCLKSPGWAEAGLTALAQHTLQSGKVHNAEVEFVSASGHQIWLHCHMGLFNTSGESHLLVMLSDVTKRKHAEEELMRLPAKILQAQEAERLRVSRDLHDGVNQMIASAKMRLHNVLEDSLGVMRPSQREILKRCERLLFQALEENRVIAHNLRPTDLDELGFEAACRSFCAEFSTRANLKVGCDIVDLGKRLPEPVELTMFRILQEALNNIEKHAGATRVNVNLTGEGGVVTLSVHDDGCGMRAPTPETKRGSRKGQGMGLLGMKERAAIVGAELRVASSSGAGTTVSVSVKSP